MAISGGSEIACRLIRAILGPDHPPVRRVVLDLSVNGVVVAYVEEFPDAADLEAAAALVEAEGIKPTAVVPGAVKVKSLAGVEVRRREG